MDHIAEIRQFVKKLLTARGDKQAFTDSSSIFLSGRLSSVDAVELVVMLEELCGVDFAETGFDQAQIDTIEAVQALIKEAGVAK
jgi:acyl carrier protein